MQSQSSQSKKWLTAAILLPCLLLVGACGPQVTPTAQPLPAGVVTVGPNDVLGSIRTYLLEKLNALKERTASLKSLGDRYYDLTQTANGDYTALWRERRADVTAVLEQARTEWGLAKQLYAPGEGIVAGVPELARYEIILDSGSPGEEGAEMVVPFDLTLPNGEVLVKPGSLFDVTEADLWGSNAKFVAPGIVADVDGDGRQEPGEALPDAGVLKSAADALDGYTAELIRTAQQWQPSAPDAFTALAVMVPSIGERFESWKNALQSERDKATSGQLAGVPDIISGLIAVHAGLGAQIRAAGTGQDEQIGKGLRDLQTFAAGIQRREQDGHAFTPEEADLLAAEASDRVTALTGQITQVMQVLNVQVESGTATCSGGSQPAATPTATP